MCDFDPFELLARVGRTVDFQQVLQLHALVHVEDSLFIALIESLLLCLLFHGTNLSVPRRQDLVREVELCFQLQENLARLVRVKRPKAMTTIKLFETVEFCFIIIFSRFKNLSNEPVLNLQLLFELLDL